MKYKYFVSFWYKSNLGAGEFGNSEVNCDKLIEDMPTVAYFADCIEKQTGFHKVTILFYNLMKVSTR